MNLTDLDRAEPIYTPPLVIVSANPNKPERLNYLTSCLASLRDRLRHHGQPVECYCVAESPGRGLADSFYGRLRDYDVVCGHVPRKPAPNLAVSLNHAFRTFAERPILYVQDDYELVQPLDLTQDIAYLGANFFVGCIRYCRCDSTALGEVDWCYEWLDSNYFPYYSHSPHLRRPRLHEYVGPFQEYQDHFQTEVEMSRRMAERPHRIVLRKQEYFRNLGQVSSLDA